MQDSTEIKILPDDIFLVSYPRSGSTWLRFLIASYLADQETDFFKFMRVVPDIHYNPQQVDQLQKIRIIKSHFPYTPDYQRVVYLVRDGRDIAISYYFYALKFRMIDQGTSFEEFLERFNQGTVDRFTIWSSHVNSWCNASIKDFLLLKYEDMQINCVQELTKLLNFANIPVDKARIQCAVAACEFSKMQKIEKEQTALAGLFRKSDTNASFIREGRSGQWTEFFSNELLNRFIAVHGEALEQLGYLSPRITQGIRQLQQNLQQAEATYQQAEAKLNQLTIDWQRLSTELQHSQSQIQQLQIASQQANQQARKRLKRLKRLKEKVNDLQAETAAMRSSKFWKLRKLWLQVKSSLLRHNLR